ncbi:GNAT family N-acetyltransferase [Solihabitans fulvus]|uniref:GNAT family N-acetyltransferase n=1 Tax=Solihabitans fulvus TaxID=1892852 RepID=UPI001CB763C6|nr:GNAT family N-acetyltransferase [Solihabitans fulvus]
MATSGNARTPLTIRTAERAELPAICRLFAAAFLGEVHDSSVERFDNVFEPDRFHLTFDGAELIGSAGVLSREMTFPGNMSRPVAGVTAVTVAPGHRRRGVLTGLMRTQLHGLHEAGAEPVAVLWASEAGIYGRFGYGPAAQQCELALPRGAAFHSTVDLGEDRVREVPREDAYPSLTKIFARVAPTRTGWLSRGESDWKIHFGDEPHHREGASSLRFALHSNGYVVYRAKENWTDRGPRNELLVQELVAETPQAYAALYRYLLDFDLVGEVKLTVAPDEPVVHLLTDPRAALRRNTDSLWVRLVDLDRALPQRTYSSGVDTVLEVTDEFCPWNAGRWRLTVDDSGSARVSRTEDAADLALGITELGAAFLGGTRLTTLAGAQRVREYTPGAVAALSRSFAGDTEPHCPEVF